MRYLIFLILAGFTGVTAWGQTSTTARPMAVNDTLTEDSTYVLQEVVVRTSPVKRKADRFILSVPPAQNKDGVELLQQAPGVWLSDERISINGSSVDIDANDTMAEVYEKIRAAAEVGEAEMKTDDGTFTGLQASRYGSSAALVITFSGKEGVSTTKDFATALGYTTDLTTDAKTGTMTYDAAKAGNSGTDAEVELSVGKVIAGTKDTSIFTSTATVATDGNRVTITDRDGFSMSFLAKEGKTGKTVFDVTDIGNMTLHIGANEHQNMDVRIQEISCETLYIDDLDVTTVTGSDRAISALDDAIAMVSDARSKIGAYENRLEYATSSLDTFEENMTDAMSRLTDVDMAEEMTNYTQYNVLQQAGVSVLSQANDLPQNVLSLLQ